MVRCASKNIDVNGDPTFYVPRGVERNRFRVEDFKWVMGSKVNPNKIVKFIFTFYKYKIVKMNRELTY